MVLFTYFDLIQQMNLNLNKVNNSNNISDLIKILNNNEYRDAEDIVIYIFQPIFELIINSMKVELDDKLYSENQISFVLFILNIIYIIVGYLIYVVPYQNSLKDEIERTQKMIEIIPEEIQILYMKNYYERE